MSKLRTWWQVQTWSSVGRLLIMSGIWIVAMLAISKRADTNPREAVALLALWSIPTTLTAILALSFKWTTPLPKQ